MYKAIKYFLLSLIICIMLIVVIFAGVRYGYRLFGFAYCTDINSIHVENVEVTSREVHVTGEIGASMPAFIGYVYKNQNGKLYVGLKYNYFFGFFKRQGAFDITIKTNTHLLNEVILKDELKERQIWEPNGNVGSEMLAKLTYPIIDIYFDKKDSWLLKDYRIDSNIENSSKPHVRIIDDSFLLNWNKEYLSCYTVPAGRGTTTNGWLEIYKNGELYRRVEYISLKVESEVLENAFKIQ